MMMVHNLRISLENQAVAAAILVIVQTIHIVVNVVVGLNRIFKILNLHAIVYHKVSMKGEY